MHTFINIFQNLQEIAVIDQKKMDTKEKAILWHTDRHVYTYWEGMVKVEGLGVSRE